MLASPGWCEFKTTLKSLHRPTSNEFDFDCSSHNGEMSFKMVHIKSDNHPNFSRIDDLSKWSDFGIVTN